MGERKKKESQDSEKEKTAPEKNGGNHLHSVILFALGILSALLILVKGTAGWRAMHNVLTGIFGVSVIAVPVLFIYI